MSGLMVELGERAFDVFGLRKEAEPGSRWCEPTRARAATSKHGRHLKTHLMHIVKRRGFCA